MALTAYALATHEPLSWEFAVETVPAAEGEPRFEIVFDHAPRPASAHSPSLSLFEDRAEILWFEGTREGHEDVFINRVRLSPGQEPGAWQAGEVAPFFDRHILAAQTDPRQEIWSLGNTIQLARGEADVLATIVYVGGWAAASIARVEFDRDGVARVRKLPLSPMLNRSHLVRSSTLRYADGTIAIPAYFEMGNAFGELVRLDRHGRVADKRRISQGRFAIQPEIVVLGPKRAVAISRNFDDATDRLIATWTEDGGRSWSAPELLDLPNPNSPVAATRLSGGRILLAFNDDAIENNVLALAVSEDDGRTWERIAILESGTGDVRYPDFARLPDGAIALTYSVGSKAGIRAVMFNEAWVNGQ